MTHQYRSALPLSVGLLTLLTQLAMAAEFTPARVAVYFSPHGGATDAVVQELSAAKTQVLLQAYGFISVPIAKALVDAHKRGVKILAVLDKSSETEKYSAATFLITQAFRHSSMISMPLPIPR
jgi:phosphatidylserine/phosphatidylglycerophosphate/cardiolipin synthase-like enzyme